MRVETFAKDTPLVGPTPAERKRELTPFSAATHNCVIELLQPKGKTDEPNPLTAEIKGWNGDDLFVSVGWGFEPVIGKAGVAWNLSQHKWRAISKEYQSKFDE